MSITKRYIEVNIVRIQHTLVGVLSQTHKNRISIQINGSTEKQFAGYIHGKFKLISNEDVDNRNHIAIY